MCKLKCLSIAKSCLQCIVVPVLHAGGTSNSGQPLIVRNPKGLGCCGEVITIMAALLLLYQLGAGKSTRALENLYWSTTFSQNIISFVHKHLGRKIAIRRHGGLSTIIEKYFTGIIADELSIKTNSLMTFVAYNNLYRKLVQHYHVNNCKIWSVSLKCLRQVRRLLDARF